MLETPENKIKFEVVFLVLPGGMVYGIAYENGGKIVDEFNRDIISEIAVQRD